MHAHYICLITAPLAVEVLKSNCPSKSFIILGVHTIEVVKTRLAPKVLNYSTSSYNRSPWEQRHVHFPRWL